MNLLERAGATPQAPALVLVHGRGKNEHQLLPLAETLDPDARLHWYLPRAPHELDDGGAQWYELAAVGKPDPVSFAAGFEALARLLDALPQPRVALGGFSQGAVMSLAVGLAAGRKRPAALIALSGFVPDLPGLELDAGRAFPPIAIGHGTYDARVPVALAHDALARLEEAGASDILYHESPLDHAIDPGFAEELRPWLAAALG